MDMSLNSISSRTSTTSLRSAPGVGPLLAFSSLHPTRGPRLSPEPSLSLLLWEALRLSEGQVVLPIVSLLVPLRDALVLAKALGLELLPKAANAREL